MAQPKPNWTEVPPRNWEEEQAHRVGLEVRRLRGKRSAQWLSDRTQECGCLVTRTVISDLEVGRRRYVTVAELLILARALDTAPIALLYPYPYYGEGKIQILPPVAGSGAELDKIFAVQWFTGELGLYLNHLGMNLVDQSNYYMHLQGLDRARKVFAFDVRVQKLRVQLGLRRNAKREGKPVSDDEIDELVSEIDELQSRIDELLKLGDRDLNAENFDQFWADHVSEGGSDGG